MSEQSEERALVQGHECAMSAVSGQTKKVASLPPVDRVYWWFGFLTAAMGAALASLGEPAFRALRGALAERESRAPPAVTMRKRYAELGIRLVKKGTYIRGELTRTKKKA